MIDFALLSYSQFYSYNFSDTSNNLIEHIFSFRHLKKIFHTKPVTVRNVFALIIAITEKREVDRTKKRVELELSGMFEI